MKTHDYGAALKRFDGALRQSTPDANGKILGQRTPAFFRDDEIASIRHALTIMQALPGVIEGLRKRPISPTHPELFHDALDAVLEKMKQMEKNDE